MPKPKGLSGFQEEFDPIFWILPLAKSSLLVGMKKAFDLDERLLQFALRVIDEVEGLPETKTCTHVGGQLLRSGTSVALNYSEAESPNQIKTEFTSSK